MDNENKPLVPAKAGDPITAGNWNKMQCKLREEHIQHAHTGVWQNDFFDGAQIGTAGLADRAVTGAKVHPDTALAVRTLTVTDALAVTGVATAGSLKVTGTSDVAGAATAGSLKVTGASEHKSLAVTGPATLGSLAVTGAATLGSLAVTGPAKLDSLEVTGTATLKRNLAVQGNLEVTGAAKAGNLEVTGAAKAGSLEVTGAAILGSLKVNGVAIKATAVFTDQPGGLPHTGHVTTAGGTLLLFASGMGRRTSNEGWIGMRVEIDGCRHGLVRAYTNEPNKHMPFSAVALLVTGVPAGTHEVALKAEDGTDTDHNDVFNLTVLEIPN